MQISQNDERGRDFRDIKDELTSYFWPVFVRQDEGMKQANGHYI